MGEYSRPAEVLIVSHSVPQFPGPGAETRAYCLSRKLSEEFKLTFLIRNVGPQQQTDLIKLSQLGEVWTYGTERRWRRFEWRWQQFVAKQDKMRRLNPLKRSPDMVQALVGERAGLGRKLAEINWDQFDLVHFIHPHTAGVLGVMQIPVPKTLDWVDESTNVLERSLAWQDSPIERAATRMEMARIRRYQQRIGQLFDATFVSAPLDAERLLADVPGERPTIVANGVDTTYFDNRVVSDRPQTGTLLFSGHMGYAPNIDAILYFWREIWPLLARRFGDARLMIVGTSPSESVNRLGQENPECITVTGRVEDVRPYLAQACICLAPLRTGSGTRLKIVEAMAMARPVVSTSIGCEGLQVQDGENILIRDSPQAFAQALSRLLEDQTEWQRFSDNGRVLVVQNYDWNELAEPIARTWRRLIG